MKSNLNLILTKLNFGIRTVVFEGKNFKLGKLWFWPTLLKIQAIIPKQKKTKRKKKLSGCTWKARIWDYLYAAVYAITHHETSTALSERF